MTLGSFCFMDCRVVCNPLAVGTLIHILLLKLRLCLRKLGVQHLRKQTKFNKAGMYLYFQLHSMDWFPYNNQN